MTAEQVKIRKENKLTRSQRKALTDKIEKRLKRLFWHPDFDDSAKIKEILAPMPGQELWLEKTRQIQLQYSVADSNEHMRVCYEAALLTREQEYHLFRMYNYYKYCAKLNLEAGKLMSAFKNIKLADAVRKRITSANVRLAFSLVKKYRNQRYYEDLISESYCLILRVVDFFDFTRGFKFSTYGTWSIVRTVSRTAKNWQKDDIKFQMTPEEFKIDAEAGTTDAQKNFESRQNKELVESLLNLCDERERRVLELHFFEGKTLLQIGEIFNLTKERIRQIEAKGIAKISREAKKLGINPDVLCDC